MNGQLLNGASFQVEELSFLQLNIMKTDLMREGKIMKEQEILEYSMELSLLTQLLYYKLITEQEYQKVKQQLMKEYKIVSDITAMTAEIKAS